MYQQLIKQIKTSDEIITVIFNISNIDCLLVYSSNIGDIKEFNSYYFPKININNLYQLDNIFPGIVTKDKDTKNIFNDLSKGFMFLFTSPENYFKFNLPISNNRSIETSVIDPIDLFSSQDGFIEDLDTNIALIRKHLSNQDVFVEYYTLNNVEKNKVALVSLKDYNNYNEEIKSQLNQINNKNVTSINTINKRFQGKHFVPMTLSTSSVQNVSLSIMKGKTAILLDGSPVSSIVPVNLFLFSTMKTDVNTPIYYSFFSRLLVLLFLIISVFLLGFYVALINFHTSSLTIYSLSNLKLTEKGTTLPMFLEISIILMLFELYRYATSRSSSGYIQNIIIFLGGLFIGQNAIKSGLIGPLILLLTSICYLSTFAFTNNLHLITTISLSRIFVISFSYFLGLYGFLIAAILIFTYLLTTKSFDKEYFFDGSISLKNKVKEYFTPTEGNNNE